MITLKTTKKMWIAYSENYITNGNWMFHKNYLNRRTSSQDFVNMVDNTAGFIFNNGLFDTKAALPKTSQLISNNIEGYVLKKTDVLVDVKTGYARIYQIKNEDSEILNIWIDDNYSKMFDDYKLIMTDFKETTAIKVIDNYSVIGLIMPILLSFKGVNL